MCCKPCSLDGQTTLISKIEAVPAARSLRFSWFLSGSLSILTAIFQVNPGFPVSIEAKDDGGGGDNWTTGAISCAKLQSNHHH